MIRLLHRQRAIHNDEKAVFRNSEMSDVSDVQRLKVRLKVDCFTHDSFECQSTRSDLVGESTYILPSMEVGTGTLKWGIEEVDYHYSGVLQNIGVGTGTLKWD